MALSEPDVPDAWYEDDAAGPSPFVMPSPIFMEAPAAKARRLAARDLAKKQYVMRRLLPGLILRRAIKTKAKLTEAAKVLGAKENPRCEAEKMKMYGKIDQRQRVKKRRTGNNSRIGEKTRSQVRPKRTETVKKTHEKVRAARSASA